MNELFFSDEEIQAAQNWHGGQASMLYAIASTGSLTRGTIRPSERCHGERCETNLGCKACNGRMRIYLTDEEWFRSLCERLSSEASKCLTEAKKRRVEARRARQSDEVDELTTDIEAFELMVMRADAGAQGKELV